MIGWNGIESIATMTDVSSTTSKTHAGTAGMQALVAHAEDDCLARGQLRTQSPRRTSTRERKQAPTWALLLFGMFLVALLGSGSEVHAQSLSPITDWSDDACLNDVFFLDSELGWVVGDRGVILRTTDGGRRWEQIVSPVECKLDGVFFNSARDGWIVGGFAEPVTHLSTGVVLRTKDGGRTWRRISNSRIPWMKQIHMATDRAGWALGHRSPIFPSGLMLTQDGGASWRPFPGEVQGEWTAAARLGMNQFALVGRDRTASVANQGELETAFVWPTGEFDLHTIAMVDQRYGWTAGDAGSVLMTDDGGGSWDEPPVPLDANVAREFDWRTIAARGDRVWVAGNPGSRIGRSVDQGQSWEWVPTGSNFPINRIYFLDEDRGWAIGDMGTILSTIDGGRTWLLSRNAAERVALLGVFESHKNIPLELFARHSGNDGCFSAVSMLDKIQTNQPTVSPIHDRIHLALSNVGVSGYSFDLASSREGNESSEYERLKERLVRQLRTWRPEVVVCDAVDDSSTPQRISIELFREAIRDAADESKYPNQVTQAGLQPWRVTKLFTRSLEDERRDELLPINQFAPRLGTSLEDYCLVGNGLIKPFDSKVELQQGWRFVGLDMDGAFSPGGAGGSSLFSGIDPNRMREMQRVLLPPGPGNLEVMRRQARKWEWIDRISVTTTTTGGDADIWMREVEGLLIGLGPTGGGNVLFQLALAHEKNRQYEAAARAMHMLVTDYQDHPLWDGAILWLIRYYSSSEARWLLHPKAAEPHINVAAEPTDDDPYADVMQDFQVQQTEYHDPVQVPFSLRQRIDDRHIHDVGVDDRAGHARQLIQTLANRRPLVAALAQVEISQAAVDRVWTGMQPTSTQAIASARQAGGRWGQLGAIEHWLREAVDAPPVPVMLCRKALSPPNLDGDLGDPIWEQTPVVELGLLGAESRLQPTQTKIRIAYDHEFLFLAVECQQVGTDTSEASPELKELQPRERDAAIGKRDRIAFALDVDRDYATAFVFEVDPNGKCRESTLGSTDWNPQWFIAPGRQGEAWTAEIAIPFSQLGIATPNDRDAWGIALQRCLPGEKPPFKSTSFLGEPQVDSVLLFIE